MKFRHFYPRYFPLFPEMCIIVDESGVKWSRKEGKAVFLGTYEPKLDDKARLILPARFRDQLAGGVVITPGQ